LEQGQQADKSLWLAGWQPGGEDGGALRLLSPGGAGSPRLVSDGDLALVFGGALHNGAELGRRVAAQAASPKDDARLLLQAYRLWGEAILPDLRGVFAFVLWDGAQRTLLCARDPLGLYPLFYAEAGAELLVSPAISRLLAWPQVSQALNRPVLAEHLSHRWARSEETYYEAIRRVPPGHLLRYGPAGRRVARYW